MPEIASEMCDAMLSSDPAERVAVRRALAASGESPFDTPLEIFVQREPEFAVGTALAPLHGSGPAGERTARLMHAVFVDQPDVLVLREPLPAAERDWLAARIEGDDATLEQVLTAPYEADG